MYAIFLGLMMLASVATASATVTTELVFAEYKSLIECKDHELGVLMTLSQRIEDGVPSTVFRITSKGQNVPLYFNRPSDHDEQQLRKAFSVVCLHVLSNPALLDGGVK